MPGRTRGLTRPERPWVDSPDLEAYLAGQGAPEADKAFVRQLVSEGVGIIDLGEEGRALADRAVEQTRRWFADASVLSVQNAWLRAPAVRALADHPRIKALLQLAYGRRPFAFQTLNFERGTEQATHADSIHFDSEPGGFMCGVWLALEDISPDAGPIEYVEGSHRLPVLTMQGAGVNRAQPEIADYDRVYIPAIQARLEASGLPRRQLPLRKGQALVWASNLAHGGATVQDRSTTRRSLVTHYFFDGCLYFTPRLSNPSLGLYDLRLPDDIGRGGFVWPRRDGRLTAPPLRAVLGAVGRRVLRRPFVARARDR